jgi:hypothetical protein
VNPSGSTVFVLFLVVIGVFQKQELGSECVCEIRFLFDPVWVVLMLGWRLVICESFGFDCFLRGMIGAGHYIYRAADNCTCICYIFHPKGVIYL